MQPYVAESRRAEEGVAKGMEGYIGIAGPEKPLPILKNFASLIFVCGLLVGYISKVSK